MKFTGKFDKDTEKNVIWLRTDNSRFSVPAPLSLDSYQLTGLKDQEVVPTNSLDEFVKHYNLQPRQQKSYTKIEFKW